MPQEYANQQPSGYNNHIRNIAIVGAGGQCGTYITKQLLAAGKHTVTALTRADSSNTFENGVKIAKVDYDSHESLVNGLKGQDALIITMAVTAPPDTSTKLIKAAADAKVPWVLPNEWGLDHLSKDEATDTMIGNAIVANRKLVTDLGVSSFIAFICGFWYEYSLSFSPVSYGFDFKNREVTFYDKGTTKINTSTFPHVGRGVASLLSLPILPADENDKSLTLSHFRNGMAYVSSFCMTQKDMFESVKRVTGTSDADWTIKYQDVKERFEEGVKILKSGNRLGFGQLLYARVFYPEEPGNFEARVGTYNEKLGLPQDDLDEFTKLAVKWADEKGQRGYNSAA